MGSEKANTDDDGLSNKRLNIENPLDALPKDKGWAWMCLLAGFIVNTLVAGGVFKSFGVIFTALQHRYQTTSGVISKIPAILLALAHGLSTPANLLAARYGTRWVVFCGGLLAATGFLLSAYAADAVPLIYLTYGVVIGVGLSLSYSPSIVAVGQYFEKRRATANGVSFAGSGLGSLILPPLIRFVKLIQLALDTYGLDGALLLMGGMTLNICVCGMLFRPPEFYFRRHVLNQKNQRAILQETTKLHDSDDGDANGRTSFDGAGRSQDCADGIGAITTHTRQQSGNVYDEVTPMIHDVDNSECMMGDRSRDDEDQHASDVDVTPTTNLITLGDEENQSHVTSKKTTTGERKFDRVWLMFINPVVLLYAVSAGVSNSSFLSTFIMAPPHAEQLGFGSTNAALLVSIMGVADLLARMGVGFIADKNIIKKKYILHLCMATGGLTLCIVPMVQSFGSLVVTLSLFSVANGSFVFMMPTLLAESLGIENLPVAYGIANLFVGCACLFSPSFLGILRDATGQWDASFTACGVLMFGISMLYFVEPWALKIGRRRLNIEDKKPTA